MHMQRLMGVEVEQLQGPSEGRCTYLRRFLHLSILPTAFQMGYSLLFLVMKPFSIVYQLEIFISLAVCSKPKGFLIHPLRELSSFCKSQGNSLILSDPKSQKKSQHCFPHPQMRWVDQKNIEDSFCFCSLSLNWIVTGVSGQKPSFQQSQRTRFGLPFPKH